MAIEAILQQEIECVRHLNVDFTYLQSTRLLCFFVGGCIIFSQRKKYKK